MADDQSKKPHVERKTHIVELTGGLQTDQFAESVPVTDCNNVEVLPSAGGMFNRRGHVRWTKYAPKTDPEGRIALLVDSQPPNMSDGTWLISAVDTSVQTNPVVYLQPFKPRTNLPGDTLVSQISWELSAYTTDYGDTVELAIVRIGAIDRAVTVTWETYDGNAEAGTDYTAGSGSVTFLAGEKRKVVEVVTLDAEQAYNSHFYARLKEPTVGGEIVDPTTTSVSMGGTPVASAYHPVLCKTKVAMSDTTAVTGMFFADMTAEAVAERFKFHYLALPVSGLSDSSATGVTPPVFVDADTFAIAVGKYVGGQESVSVLFYRVAAMKAAGAAYADEGATDRASARKDSPIKTVTFDVPDDEFINDVGPHLTVAPDGGIWYVGRSAIVKLDGATRDYVETVTLDDLPGNPDAGNYQSAYIGSNSDGVSYVIWESDSAHFWQWRLDDDADQAFFCKVNVDTGEYDVILTDPLDNAGLNSYDGTYTVRMASGAFITFNTEGDGAFATVDGTTTSIDPWHPPLGRFITAIGNDKVLYTTSAENHYAAVASLLVDDVPEPDFTVGTFALGGNLGPTWLDADKALLTYIDGFSQTFAVVALADGEVLETDDMTEAFGATSKDGDFLAPAEWGNSWSVQKAFFGGAE